jgi:hypothetical protein
LARQPQALVAFPTHRGGWLRTAPSADASADPFDRVAARLRSVRACRIELRPRLERTGQKIRVRFERGPIPSELEGVEQLAGALDRLGRGALDWWSPDHLWIATTGSARGGS